MFAVFLIVHGLRTFRLRILLFTFLALKHVLLEFVSEIIMESVGLLEKLLASKTSLVSHFLPFGDTRLTEPLHALVTLHWLVHDIVATETNKLVINFQITFRWHMIIGTDLNHDHILHFSI